MRGTGPVLLQGFMHGIALVCLVLLAGCQQARENRPPASAVTITFIGWGPATVRELSADEDIIEQFTRASGIRVHFIAGPESMTDRLQLYQKYFESKSATPDVYYLDIVWPAVLADQLVDLNEYLKAEASELLESAVKNSTVEGKLTSMPFNTELGLLYYRADLLNKYGYKHPPTSWDELEKMAARIQTGERAAGNADFWGFVWQGAAYEGLTCNALEWQLSNRGGMIIEPDGTISVNNPRAIGALKRARRWIGTISPPSVTAFKEQDSRNVWNAGNAAFTRDWIWRQYKGEMLKPSLKDKVGIAPLPAGTNGHVSALGGQSLAISKYSTHPREAAEFIKFLTSHDVQVNLWNMHAMLPTRRDFYADPRFLELQPAIGNLWNTLNGEATARPSVIAGKRYDEVSRAYFTSVHSILTGEVEAEKAVANLETKLSSITGLKAKGNEGGSTGH